MNDILNLDSLLFVRQCRAGRIPPKRSARRKRRPRSQPMTDEERRTYNRDYQRQRREDPWERDRDRAYARDHYYRNREKRLRQMKEYQQRLKRKEGDNAQKS
ncbi:hypothetical protein [Bifidobacterium sp. UTBIF-78]|uniref:hypothetical protein n=1 Tax=Bifidobacterium sp. UTBIF-78 TaxID=1465263 RepID=UPI0011293F5F|nr:hypothetical protein [Bifidobacterium sp. UTBIF-78]